MISLAATDESREEQSLRLFPKKTQQKPKQAEQNMMGWFCRDRRESHAEQKRLIIFAKGI